MMVANDQAPARGEPGYKRTKLRKGLLNLFGRGSTDERAGAVPSTDEGGDGGDGGLDDEEDGMAMETAKPEAKVEAAPTAEPANGVVEEAVEEAAEEAAVAAAGSRWSAEELEQFSCVELSRVRAMADDPSNPAEALRTRGEDGRIIDESELACCWLLHEAPAGGLPLPRFRVTARPSQILEPELRQMAIVLRKCLDREETFTIMWDLRKLRPPTLSALNYGGQWQSENAADIERLGQSIVVLVSSPVTRVCANLCLRVCNPPQPALVCTDEAKATEFAREQFERLGGGGA